MPKIIDESHTIITLKISYFFLFLLLILKKKVIFKNANEYDKYVAKCEKKQHIQRILLQNDVKL